MNKGRGSRGGLSGSVAACELMGREQEQRVRWSSLWGKAGNPETATGSHGCSSETDWQSDRGFRFSLLVGNCGGTILENGFC